MKVAVSQFVRRQVKGSGKTYSKTMSFEAIAEHAEIQMENGHFSNGYRDGVRIVHCNISIIGEFFCPIIKLNENSELVSKLVRRRPEEDLYIQIRAIKGTPLKAEAVNLILYRNDVLSENDEQSTDAGWELISINAIPSGLKKMPMGPITMMRNQLELPGGTKAHYSSDEWAESVRFWQEVAGLEPENDI
ncbi:MAG: DUF3228 family protein [Fidelibacterota bacterium]